MRANSNFVYTYAIDADDAVVSVGPEWLAFAQENQASSLTEASVVGRSLFEFMSGEETKRLYRIVFDRVRSDRQNVLIPFRCDGPKVRRFMELQISPGKLGGIELGGRVVREETRQGVRLFDSSVERSQDSVLVCAWCKHVQVENGQWLEVEAAISALGLFESLPLPGISQGVCEACEKKMVSAINA